MAKKILIGVLDWGLGHATRCIPLIDYLLQLECQIFIAASGPPKKLLEVHYPHIQFLDAPPYGVSYPANQRITLTIGKSMPKLIRVINLEHEWLQRQHSIFGFDHVISDNRYGLWSDVIPSVIITHQLSPISGFGALADHLVRKLHYHYLGRFRECWVPDHPVAPGLAGRLSHPGTIPLHTRYIGPLSRLECQRQFHSEPQILALVSGPEPSRTVFEHLLLSQLKSFECSHLLVRGLPSSLSAGPPNTVNHAAPQELNKLMANAGLIICRSGYTSIMDLVKLKKRAVLVPTPGQTEQEYLAEHLQLQSVFPYIEQKDFSVAKAMERADQFEYKWPELQYDGFRAAIDELIQQ